IAEERFDDATVLALRSLVRDLEVRTLLDVTVGMTAHEAAASASHSFPDLTSRLQRGADAFDTAAYSHRAVAAKQAEDLLRLTEYRSEEHTSELQSRFDLVCRLLLEKKKNKRWIQHAKKVINVCIAPTMIHNKQLATVELRSISKRLHESKKIDTQASTYLESDTIG